MSIDQDERGPYIIIYKTHIGPYHKIVSTIQEIETWAQTQGFKCRLSFGEYFDDPRVVEEGRLNSRGGCIIDPVIEKEVLERFKKDLASTLPQDFKISEIQKTKAVVALFSGAPGIGPLKVYPKVEDYIIEHKLTPKGSVIEIYEVLSEQSVVTTYLWPL